MKLSDLTASTVAELKALAKKKKVSLPKEARKADIIAMLMAWSKPEKTEREKPRPKTAAAKPAVTKAAAPKTAVKKPAARKAAEQKKESPKPAARTMLPKPKAVEAPVPAIPAKAVLPKSPEPVLPRHEWKVPPTVEEPHLAQERVAESKYYTGSGEQPWLHAAGELPRTYGQDRIMLMARDPFVVHAYWEATPERLRRERVWFGWDAKLCIRIYDVTGVQFDGRNAIGYFDQEVDEQSGSWYFDLGRPGHSFCADVGILAPSGRFLTLSRSNYITMQRDSVSDLIDEEWNLADEEFWRLYGGSEGFQTGATSPRQGFQEWELLRRRRLQEITSPGVSRERTKARRK